MRYLHSMVPPAIRRCANSFVGVANARVASLFGVLASRGRQVVCGMHGHEMMLRFDVERLSLRCSTCGAQTCGWEIGGRPAFRRPQNGGAARSRFAHQGPHAQAIPGSRPAIGLIQQNSRARYWSLNQFRHRPPTRSC